MHRSDSHRLPRNLLRCTYADLHTYTVTDTYTEHACMHICIYKPAKLQVYIHASYKNVQLCLYICAVTAMLKKLFFFDQYPRFLFLKHTFLDDISRLEGVRDVLTQTSQFERDLTSAKLIPSIFLHLGNQALQFLELVFFGFLWHALPPQIIPLD